MTNNQRDYSLREVNSLRYAVISQLDDLIAILENEGYKEDEVVNELIHYLNTKPL